MNYASEVNKMIARCRRIGLQVDQPPPGGAAWIYRIHCPNGKKVVLHGTPRDANFEIENRWKDLDANGFKEAELRHAENVKASKAAKLAEDRRKAAEQAERIARQSAAVVKAAGPLAGPQPVDAGWLMTPTDRAETRTVVMTPDVAEKVLDTMNTHNRPLTAARVTYFENLLRDNEFGCTHQGGAIDWNGVLQDGQSRLKAIANTGISATMQWSVGMDPANFTRLDTGANRSAKDTAYIMGEVDPLTISSAAKMLLMIDRYGPDAHSRAKSGRVSNDAIEAAILRYGDPLREAVEAARAIKRDVRKANPSALACAVYLIRARMPEDDERVSKFFDDLQEGGSGRTDVVWQLRQSLLNGQPPSGRSYNAWHALALILKTWNYRHTGRVIKTVMWRPNNEPFPCHIFLPPPPESEAA